MTKDDKTFYVLTQRLGEMVKENEELVLRVHELTDDYNRVVKQLRANTMTSNLAETLNKVEYPECDCIFLKKKIEQVEKAYMDLLGSLCDQYEETKTVKKKCKAAEKRYKDLQHKYEELSIQLNTAKSKREYAEKRLDESEDEYYTLKDLHEVALSRLARFEHANFVGMGYICAHKHNVKVGYLHKSDVEVGSLACFNCVHYIKSDFVNTKTILCAYNYDKEKEKQQEEEKFHRKNNS